MSLDNKKREELFENRVVLAGKGKDIWKSLVKQYKIDFESIVILIPDEQYEDYVIKNLGIISKDFTKVLLLSVGVIHGLPKNVQTVMISMDDKRALLQLYCLFDFASNFYIASFEEPSTRRGKGFLKIIPEEELFKLLIFHIEESVEKG